VEVFGSTAFPVVWLVDIVIGLSNGCVEFDRWEVERAGTTVTITVFNLVPRDDSIVACTQEYRTLDERIALGAGFDVATRYTVIVNGVETSFVP
jgi:hypothetical protein